MTIPMEPARQFVECVLPEVDGRFHYHLPPGLSEKKVAPGIRLLVPFGRAWKVAFFIQKVAKPEVTKTKQVLACLDETSLIKPVLFKLLCWISDYYMTPLGGVIKGALPQGIHALPRRRFRRITCKQGDEAKLKSALQKKILTLLEAHETLTDRELQRHLGRAGLNNVLSALKKKGLIEAVWEIAPPPVWTKVRKVIILKNPSDVTPELIASLKERAPKQTNVLNQLLLSEGKLPLAELEGSDKAAVRRLIEKGIVAQIEEPALRRPRQGDGFRAKGAIQLNKDQEAVVKIIRRALLRKRFAPFLLHGVTGSGKTEVYLRAIETSLRSGKGAILLLPEIGLTTHIAARFQERFGDQVALLHSGLSPGERYDEWRRIQTGEARLAIGARSAVFAPLKSLGVIIVDEEHDASYRQEEGSRYHGRDVALVRGRDEDAVVILGSATPSFESYYNAKKGKYGYLHLPGRIDTRSLPTVHLIDLKEKPAWIRPFFTRPLYLAIKKRLAAKEQILLFVNRRGFSPFLLCYNCGFIPVCDHCSVSLTFHKGLRRLICHYCGHQTAPPGTCPKCRGTHVSNIGIGTEQIEETIRILYPGARIARLDRDTAQRKGAYHEILGAMAREEIDILIGTQMIAKGHDFSKVTLVGVLSADLSLHLPDFRSSERTFQLLAQVAGRAGRGKRPGEVIVQTFQPEDSSILAASFHDYVTFFKDCIPLREERGYPPYSRLILLLLTHHREEGVASGASSLADFIKKGLNEKEVKLLGPAPAPLLRLKKTYRYQMLLKGRDQQKLAAVLRPAIDRWKRSSKGGIRLHIEVDPQQFV